MNTVVSNITKPKSQIIHQDHIIIQNIDQWKSFKYSIDSNDLENIKKVLKESKQEWHKNYALVTKNGDQYNASLLTKAVIDGDIKELISQINQNNIIEQTVLVEDKNVEERCLRTYTLLELAYQSHHVDIFIKLAHSLTKKPIQKNQIRTEKDIVVYLQSILQGLHDGIITKVDLSNIKMSNKGIEILAKTLKEYTGQPIDLCLSNCSMSDHATQLLAKTLGSCQKIKSLDISHNSLQPATVAQISNCLATNHNISSADFSGLRIFSYDLLKFIESIKKQNNRQLNITISTQYLDEATLDYFETIVSSPEFPELQVSLNNSGMGSPVTPPHYIDHALLENKKHYRRTCQTPPTNIQLAAVLPHEGKLSFFVEEPSACDNADRSFDALGTTRDDFANTLLQLKENSDARDSLIHELKSFFEQLADEQVKANPALYIQFQNHKTLLENQKTDLKKLTEKYQKTFLKGTPSHPLTAHDLCNQLLALLGQKNTNKEEQSFIGTVIRATNWNNKEIKTLKEAIADLQSGINILNKFEGQLEHYLQSEEAFECYVAHFKKGLPLSIGSCVLYANHKKIPVCLWSKQDNNHQLSYMYQNNNAPNQAKRNIIYDTKLKRFTQLNDFIPYSHVFTKHNSDHLNEGKSISAINNEKCITKECRINIDIDELNKQLDKLPIDLIDTRSQQNVAKLIKINGQIVLQSLFPALPLIVQFSSPDNKAVPLPLMIDHAKGNLKIKGALYTEQAVTIKAKNLSLNTLINSKELVKIEVTNRFSSHANSLCQCKQLVLKGEQLDYHGKLIVHDKFVASATTQVHFSTASILDINQLEICSESISLNGKINAKLSASITAQKTLELSEQGTLNASLCNLNSDFIKIKGKVNKCKNLSLTAQTQLTTWMSSHLNADNIAIKTGECSSNGEINATDHVLIVCDHKATLCGNVAAENILIQATACDVDTTLVSGGQLSLLANQIHLSKIAEVITTKKTTDAAQAKQSGINIKCQNFLTQPNSNIHSATHLKLQTTKLINDGKISADEDIKMAVDGCAELHKGSSVESGGALHLEGDRLWNSGTVKAKKILNLEFDKFIINGLSQFDSATELFNKNFFGNLESDGHLNIVAGAFVNTMSALKATTATITSLAYLNLAGATMTTNITKSNIINIDAGINLPEMKSIVNAFYKIKNGEIRNLSYDVFNHLKNSQNKINTVYCFLSTLIQIVSILMPQYGLPASIASSLGALVYSTYSTIRNGKLLFNEANRIYELYQTKKLNLRQLIPFIARIKDIMLGLATNIPLVNGIADNVSAVRDIEYTPIEMPSIDQIADAGCYAARSLLSGTSTTDSLFSLRSGINFGHNTFDRSIANISAFEVNTGANSTDISVFIEQYQSILAHLSVNQSAIYIDNNAHTFSENTIINTSEMHQGADGSIDSNHLAMFFDNFYQAGTVNVNGAGTINGGEHQMTKTASIDANHTVVKENNLTFDGSIHFQDSEIKVIQNAMLQKNATTNLTGTNFACGEKLLTEQGSSTTVNANTPQIQQSAPQQSLNASSSISVEPEKLDPTKQNDPTDVIGHKEKHEKPNHDIMHLKAPKENPYEEIDPIKGGINHTMDNKQEIGSHDNNEISPHKNDKELNHAATNVIDSSIIPEETKPSPKNDIATTNNDTSPEEIIYRSVQQLSHKEESPLVESNPTDQLPPKALTAHDMKINGKLTTIGMEVVAVNSLQVGQSGEAHCEASAVTAKKTEVEGKLVGKETLFQTQEFINTQSGNTDLNDSAIISDTVENAGNLAANNSVIEGKAAVTATETSHTQLNNSTEKSNQTISQSGDTTVENKVSLEAKELNLSNATIHGKEDSQSKLQLKSKIGSLTGTIKDVKTLDAEIEQLANAEDFIQGRGIYKNINPTEKLVFNVNQTISINQNLERNCDVFLKADRIAINHDLSTNNAFYFEVKKGDLLVDYNVAGKNIAFVAEGNVTTNNHQYQAQNEFYVKAGKSYFNYGGTVSGTETYLNAHNNIENRNGGNIIGHQYLQATAETGSILNICDEKIVHGKYGYMKVWTPSTMIGGSGEGFDGVGLRLNSGASIINSGSLFQAQGDAIINGEGEVKNDALTNSYISYKKTKHHHAGLTKETKTTWSTQIQESVIASTEGHVYVNANHGKVTAYGGHFLSKNGTDIWAEGDINLLDIQGKSIVTKNSSSFGGLISDSSKRTEDVTVSTILSSAGDIRFHTPNDVNAKGAIIYTPAQFKVEAHSAKFSAAIENHQVYETHRGITVSFMGMPIIGGDSPWDALKSKVPLSNELANFSAGNPTELFSSAWNLGIAGNQFFNNPLLNLQNSLLPDFNVCFTEKKLNCIYQTRGPGAINVGSFDAQLTDELLFENGIPVRVKGDLHVNAKTFRQEGAELHSNVHTTQHSASVTISATVEIKDASVSHSEASSQSTAYSNQELNVGGNLNLKVSSLEMNAANTSAKNVTVEANKISIVSRQDRSSSSSNSFSASASGGVSANMSRQDSTQVSQISGICAEEDVSITANKIELVGSKIIAQKDTNVKVSVIDAEKLTDDNKESSYGITGNVLKLTGNSGPLESSDKNEKSIVQISTGHTNQKRQDVSTIYGGHSTNVQGTVNGELNTRSDNGTTVTRDEKTHFTFYIPSLSTQKEVTLPKLSPEKENDHSRQVDDYATDVDDEEEAINEHFLNSNDKNSSVGTADIKYFFESEREKNEAIYRSTDNLGPYDVGQNIYSGSGFNTDPIKIYDISSSLIDLGIGAIQGDYNWRDLLKGTHEMNKNDLLRAHTGHLLSLAWDTYQLTDNLWNKMNINQLSFGEASLDISLEFGSAEIVSAGLEALSLKPWQISAMEIYFKTIVLNEDSFNHDVDIIRNGFAKTLSSDKCKESLFSCWALKFNDAQAERARGLYNGVVATGKTYLYFTEGDFVKDLKPIAEPVSKTIMAITDRGIDYLHKATTPQGISLLTEKIANAFGDASFAMKRASGSVNQNWASFFQSPSPSQTLSNKTASMFESTLNSAEKIITTRKIFSS